MEKIYELKYIPMLGLKKLKRIQQGFVCSCPICDEGKSPWKTRCFFLVRNRPYIVVFCQNCGYDTNFKTFLAQTNPHLFEDYKREERKLLIEDLKAGNINKKEKYIKPIINTDLDLKYTFKLNPDYFKPAYEYSAAINFCKKRKIIEHIDKFFYNVHPTHILSGMLIFPFTLDNNIVYGFQGRHTLNKTFHTFSKNESAKIYNLFGVNSDENVYVFESIIDSLMIENSISMLGVSLSSYVKSKMKNLIYIFDNDKRGIESSIIVAEENKKVLIYPKSFKYKDFNEAVMKGVKKHELKQMIDENVYDGMSAVVKLKLIKNSRKM